MSVVSFKRVSSIIALALLLQGCAQAADTEAVEPRASITENTPSSTPVPLDEVPEEITEPAANVDFDPSQWRTGMPIPEGYTFFGGQMVDDRAFALNPDGTLSWDSRFPPPEGFVVVDGFLLPEDVAAESRASEPGSSNQGSSNASSGQASAADNRSRPPAAPAEPIEANPSPDEEANPLPNPGGYCPGYREENPSLYDSCHAGFVAPTIEWAGYHSCRKTPDGNVQIFGKVKLVGGTYNSNDYGWDTHAIGSLGIVNSVNASSPYFVSWVAGAWFGAMDGFNKGIIAKVHGSGVEKIDESLLDPSCRL